MKSKNHIYILSKNEIFSYLEYKQEVGGINACIQNNNSWILNNGGIMFNDIKKIIKDIKTDIYDVYVTFNEFQDALGKECFRVEIYDKNIRETILNEVVSESYKDSILLKIYKKILLVYKRYLNE